MRLALLAEAEAELDDAATWYDDRSEGLGDEFISVAREAMAPNRGLSGDVATLAGRPGPHPTDPTFLAAAISLRPCVPGSSRPSRRLGRRARPAAAALLGRASTMTIATETAVSPQLEQLISDDEMKHLIREICSLDAPPSTHAARLGDKGTFPKLLALDMNA